MEIELVKGKNTDKEFLLQLRKTTMVEHLEKAGLFLSEAAHMTRIEVHFNTSFIIKESGKKIGLLKYVEGEKVIEILQLQILPEYQGKGIGKHLLNHMIVLSRSLNKELILKVLKENPARYLYERTGFQTIGEDQNEFYMRFIV